MNATTEEKFRNICRKDLHRITTVKGFYEDSLVKYSWNPEQRIVLAYVDCDYYSSTKTVLNFLSDKINHGMILAFDDWNCYYGDYERGQRKAFQEYSKKNGIQN